MPKILVLYHSTYGHVEAMAGAVAEGAREIEGATVDIKRVPELVPEALARKSSFASPSSPISSFHDRTGVSIGSPCLS